MKKKKKRHLLKYFFKKETFILISIEEKKKKVNKSNSKNESCNLQVGSPADIIGPKTKTRKRRKMFEMWG